MAINATSSLIYDENVLIYNKVSSDYSSSLIYGQTVAINATSSLIYGKVASDYSSSLIYDELTSISASVAIFNANPSIYSSVAYESGSLVNSGDCKFIKAWGYNSGASAQFIQIFNTGSFPTDAEVPLTIVRVATESNFNFDLGGTFGIDCPLGIVVCNSTTGPTKTSGAEDCWFNVAYKVV